MFPPHTRELLDALFEATQGNANTLVPTYALGSSLGLSIQQTDVAVSWLKHHNLLIATTEKIGLKPEGRDLVAMSKAKP